MSNRNLVTKQGHTHMHKCIHTQTSGGAEVFAGSSEAAGPVDIDCSNSELVPSAGSDVGQLDTLLCSLRDRWGGGANHRGQGSHRVTARCELVATSVIRVFLFAKLSKTL